MLFSLHQMAATFLTVPELELDESEAKKLAGAIADVQSHYSVGLSEKQMAWANLGMVAVGVYGTRLAAYKMRRKTEREEAKKAKAADAAKQNEAPAFVPTHLMSTVPQNNGFPN